MTERTAAARIGVLGGTLDPVHVGHVQTALAAKNAMELSTVLMMPARIPPHREQGPTASTFHRFAMAALAVADLDGLAVSDEEVAADGPSYTALTLDRLAARGLPPSQLFFITGADAFVEIETWYRYPAVLDLANFVVISRPGISANTAIERLPHLATRVRSAVPPSSDATSVYLVEAVTPDVSSTEIRRRLRAGHSISGLVPVAVERHIARHRLYAETSTATHHRTADHPR